MKIYLILFLFAFLLTLETQAKNHNKTITKKEFLDSQMKKFLKQGSMLLIQIKMEKLLLKKRRNLLKKSINKD